MYPLFETIRVFDKTIFHLEQHIARIQCSSFALWNQAFQCGNLESDIKKKATNGLQKCNLFYKQEAFKIELIPYMPRVITQLFFVEDNGIEYSLKHTNRTCFTKYNSSLLPSQEIIFLKNKVLTDSTFSNIALWNGSEWHTPLSPLFKGIRRQLLLNEKQIFEKEISIENVKNYSKIAFINAMLDLGDSIIII